jgi:hypothetical protein
VSHNLVLTLDVSGSMNGEVGNTGMSRLELAKEALIQMVQKYMEQGDVNVQLTVFNGSASSPISGWVSGQAFVNNLTDGTSSNDFIKPSSNSALTNYEAAVSQTKATYEASLASKPVADKTVAYFISDGAPTTEIDNGSPTNGDGNDSEAGYFDTPYRTQWNNFVDSATDALKVYGVGVSAAGSYLEAVAAADDAGKAPVILNDADQLAAELVGSVTGSDPITATASLGIAIGADGWGSAKLSDVDMAGLPADAPVTTAAARNYATGVAANGDQIYVTSGGEKLVYLSSADGKTLTAYKESDLNANNTVKAGASAVMSVAVSTANSTYTVTMMGAIDPHVVDNKDAKAGDWAAASSPAKYVEQVGESKSVTTQDVAGSISLTHSNVPSGDRANGGTVTYSGTSGGVTATVVVAGTDGGDADQVRVSDGSLNVGSDSNMDEDEKLSLSVSISGTPTDLKLTSITGSTSDDGGGGDGSETAVLTGATGGNLGNFTATNADGDKTHVFTIESTKGDFIVNDDLTVNYTYDKVDNYKVYEEQTVQTRDVTYTQSAYDVTLVFKVEATDGDGDAVETVFHVTVDANNDKVHEAPSASGATAVVTERVYQEQQTVVQDVYLKDGNYVDLDPTTAPVAAGSVTVVAGSDKASGDPATSTTSSDAARDTVLDALDGTFTKDDVMVGGAGNDTFTSGAGADVIQINLADSNSGDRDVITDFNQSDKLLIQDILPDANGGLDVTEAAISGGTVLTLDSDGGSGTGTVQQVEVQGNTPAQLSPSGTGLEADILTITTTKVDPTAT